MTDQTESSNHPLAATAAEVIGQSQTIDLAPQGESSESVPAAVGDDGIYLAVAEQSSLFTHLFDNPAVSFQASDADRVVSGRGRALILRSVGEEPAARAALPESVSDDMHAVRVIPHELTLATGSQTETAAHPFGQAPPTGAAVWVQAVRTFSFTASVTPILLGAVLAWFLPTGPVDWWLLPFIIIAGVLYHSASNVISDYYDYKHGVDRAGTMGGSRVLVDGLIGRKRLFVGGMVMFGVGTALGLWMVSMRGMPLLYLGLAGFIGGFFYGGWPFELKYRGLGELVIFFLFGPLMVLGSYFVLTGSMANVVDVVLISLPVSFLVVAILNANNLRDIADDTHAGITTISNAAGQKVAAIQYYLLIVGAYVSVIAMIVFGILPLWTLAVALSIPPAMKVIKIIQSSHGQHTAELAIIDQMTAQVHLLFGVLLMIGITLGKFF